MVQEKIKTHPHNFSSSEHIFKNTDLYFDPSYWLGIAPDFTISTLKNDYVFKLTDTEINHNKNRILKEGYTHLEKPGLNAPFSEMAACF